MNLKVDYNKEKKRNELLFSEELSKEDEDFLKGIGLNKHFGDPKRWLAKDHPAYNQFVKDLQEALLNEHFIQSVKLYPSFEPTEENIKNGKFKYVRIKYFTGASKSFLNEIINYEEFIVFDSYKKVAEFIATQFGEERYGPMFRGVEVFPKNHKDKARTLLKEGKVINPSKEENEKSNPVPNSDYTATKERNVPKALMDYSSFKNAKEFTMATIEEENPYDFEEEEFEELDASIFKLTELPITDLPKPSEFERDEYELFKKAIEDGERPPVTVYKRDMESPWRDGESFDIVAGEIVLKVYDELGYKLVPVLVHPFDEDDPKFKDYTDFYESNTSTGEPIPETQSTKRGLLINKGFVGLFSAKEAVANKTLSDLQGRWYDAYSKFESDFERPALEAIKLTKSSLQFYKGKKGKHAEEERKELRSKLKRQENGLEHAYEIKSLLEEENIAFQNDLRQIILAKAKSRYALRDEQVESEVLDIVFSELFDEKKVETRPNEVIEHVINETLESIYSPIEEGTDDNPKDQSYKKNTDTEKLYQLRELVWQGTIDDYKEIIDEDEYILQNEDGATTAIPLAYFTEEQLWSKLREISKASVKNDLKFEVIEPEKLEGFELDTSREGSFEPITRNTYDEISSALKEKKAKYVAIDGEGYRLKKRRKDNALGLVRLVDLRILLSGLQENENIPDEKSAFQLHDIVKRFVKFRNAHYYFIVLDPTPNERGIRVVEDTDFESTDPIKAEGIHVPENELELVATQKDLQEKYGYDFADIDQLTEKVDNEEILKAGSHYIRNGASGIKVDLHKEGSEAQRRALRNLERSEEYLREKQEHEQSPPEAEEEGLKNEKVKVDKIIVLSSEARPERDLAFESWKAANDWLSEIEPTTSGGYDKTSFQIVWEDGEEYEGRLDISDTEDNPRQTENVIGDHVYSFLMWHVKVAQGYSPYENDNTTKEVDIEAYKRFLKNYDLGLTEPRIAELNDELHPKVPIDEIKIEIRFDKPGLPLVSEWKRFFDFNKIWEKANSFVKDVLSERRSSGIMVYHLAWVNGFQLSGDLDVLKLKSDDYDGFSRHLDKNLPKTVTKHYQVYRIQPLLSIEDGQNQQINTQQDESNNTALEVSSNQALTDNKENQIGEKPGQKEILFTPPEEIPKQKFKYCEDLNKEGEKIPYRCVNIMILGKGYQGWNYTPFYGLQILFQRLNLPLDDFIATVQKKTNEDWSWLKSDLGAKKDLYTQNPVRESYYVSTVATVKDLYDDLTATNEHAFNQILSDYLENIGVQPTDVISQLTLLINKSKETEAKPDSIIQKVDKSTVDSSEQAWQTPLSKWIELESSGKALTEIDKRDYVFAHKSSVIDALKDGEDIPDVVLSDYPDLADTEKFQFGFDGTHFNSEDTFKRLLKLIGSSENPKWGFYERHENHSPVRLWEGENLRMVTANDPLVSGGYASFIGIEGRRKNVLEAVRFIEKNTDTEGDHGLEYIGFNLVFIDPEKGNKLPKADKLKKFAEFLSNYDRIDASLSNGRIKERFEELGKEAFDQLAQYLEFSEYKISYWDSAPDVSGFLTIIGVYENGKGLFVSLARNGLPKELFYRPVSHSKDFFGDGQNYYFDEKEFTTPEVLKDKIRGIYPNILGQPKSSNKERNKPEQKGNGDYLDRVIAHMQDQYADGNRVTKGQIEKLAKELEVPNMGMMWEAVELSWLLWYKMIYREPIPFERRLHKMIHFWNKVQPTYAYSDSSKEIYKQYSTPCPISAIVAQYTSMDTVSSIFEPSAGNGLLLVGADPAKTHVNEIDKTRLKSLEFQEFKTITSHNATQPFPNELARSFDVVVTNPPFSRWEEEKFDKEFIISTYFHNQIGLKQHLRLEHAMCGLALHCMKDTGKGALIIMGHIYFGDDDLIARYRPFFNWLFRHYQVDDVINMNSFKLYNKQGAAEKTMLILVSGRKGKPQGVAPQQPQAPHFNDMVDSFQELWERVKQHIKGEIDTVINQLKTELGI